MDKIFSARVGPSTLARIEVLARQLGKTKKQIIEEAIEQYSEKAAEAHSVDLLERTFGAWKRREPAQAIVAKARRPFQRSMLRHRK
jgi:predicted DNA-binding protein